MAPQPDPQYTVFIRLPFPRGDFVDPPPVEWNASKERELWEVLSQPSKESDIDWKALAERLDVTLPFILQQAAWLYDRQLAQVRAQMRKVGNQHSVPSSPLPASFTGSNPVGGQPMNRVPSGGSGVPSRLSIRQRDTPSRQDSGAPPTPIKSKAIPSTSTAAQKPAPRAQSPRNWQAHQRPPTRDTVGRVGSFSKREPKASDSQPASPRGEEEQSSEPLPSSSSSSSDSESEGASGGGPAFRKYGKYSIHRHSRTNIDDEDEEDESPAFLPPASAGEEPSGPSESDLRATLRQQYEQPSRQRAEANTTLVADKANEGTEKSTSSTSSGMASSSQPMDRPHTARRPGALSPQRAAELARLSPRHRVGQSGSEETHSMGSSFSDLDDTSVTQSALEEALMSNMQHGTIASRMSTISQALRSKYL